MHWEPKMKKIIVLVACILGLTSLYCLGDVPVNEITRQKVLSQEEWQTRYDSYQVDAAGIEAMKAKLGDVHIDIYLGLWCSDSRNNVPPFIKILDAAGVSVPVKFFNVQRKPVKTIKFFSDKYQIERVPTFIFYRGDTEIGRIIENPTTSLIEDSIAILSK